MRRSRWPSSMAVWCCRADSAASMAACATLKWGSAAPFTSDCDTYSEFAEEVLYHSSGAEASGSMGMCGKLMTGWLNAFRLVKSKVQAMLASLGDLELWSCLTFIICVFPALTKLLTTSLPGKLRLAPHAPSPGWYTVQLSSVIR